MAKVAAFLLVIYALGTTGALGAAARSDSQPSVVARYGTVLRSFNPRLGSAWARDLAGRVLMLSSYYSLDPRLLVAIVGIESGWRSDAVSPSGARGFGQLMPGTADGLSVRSSESLENLDGTARYLRRLLKQYASLGIERRYSLAVAGYNAGPGAVARWHGIPPYSETRAYVANVMGLWHRLTGALPRGDSTPLISRIRHTPNPASIATLQEKKYPIRTDSGLLIVGEGPDGPILSDAPKERILAPPAVKNSQEIVVIGEGSDGPILSDAPAGRSKSRERAR